MGELEKPIGRAWRRIRLQRFLSAFVWSLAACLALVAVAIAVEKLTNRPLPGEDWWPFAIAGGAALVVAAGVALLTGPSRVDAAVAIDRAFHLNERLSTAITLPIDLRETPAGRALVADTLRHVADLDVGSKFGLRLPRRAWVALIPAALALGLMFIPHWAQNPALASKVAKKAETEEVARQTKALGKSIAQRRKELDKNTYGETEKLFAEIEKAAEALSKSPPAQKEKALVEMNKLSDALKDRQKQLGGAEQIKNQLQQLKDMANSGPADEFLKNLGKGDFQKAASALNELQKKLNSGQMTEPQKKELQEQLAQMTKEIEKLANLDQRRKQLEEARKNGGLSQEQFDRQMAKLNDQAKSLKKLQQLAQQLDQAQQQMARGDAQKAAEALGMGQKELEQLAQQLREIESLDEALADLQDAKNGINGDGMNQLGNRLGDFAGMNQGMGDGQGNGLGRGRGQGDRPEARDDTSSYNSRVPQQITKGRAILEGYAPPREQTKGESLIDIQAPTEASSGQAAEALSNQKVPNTIKKHIIGYFDEVGKGR